MDLQEIFNLIRTCKKLPRDKLFRYKPQITEWKVKHRVLNEGSFPMTGGYVLIKFSYRSR